MAGPVQTPFRKADQKKAPDWRGNSICNGMEVKSRFVRRFLRLLVLSYVKIRVTRNA
ncbi:hypothetical protein JOJ88_004848 [Pantoea cypripedii]|nr:hypothetical protein [Pantoea cypripedii]